MKKTYLKIIIFLVIGVICFEHISYIFVPKFNYPSFIENQGQKFAELYNMQKKHIDIDVFFIGASHIETSVSPMQLYNDYQIMSYNLATSGQPALVSCYLVDSIFSLGFKPKLIVLDVSTFFNENESDVAYRYVTNNAKFDREFLRFLFAQNEELEINRFSYFLPFSRYHSRWEDLSYSDFFSSNDSNYFLQGFVATSWINASMENVDRINALSLYMNDECYRYELSEEKITLLRNIKNICDSNKCSLLLTKIPVNASPADYSGSWTFLRYETIKDFATKNDFDYLDLTYDAEIVIDWMHDTNDFGKHLNYRGSQKVSKFIGEYILNNYSIQSKNDLYYDSKLSSYLSYSYIAKLETEYSFKNYIDTMLDSPIPIYIIISIKDDMVNGLSEEDIQSLNKLELKTDFNTMKKNESFIAVVKILCGLKEVIYESGLDGMQDYDSLFGNNCLSIKSAGYFDGNLSSIKINNTEYSNNKRGMNIVVYEYEAGLVIDSSNYDSFLGNQEVVHNAKQFLYEYQEYLLGRR